LKAYQAPWSHASVGRLAVSVAFQKRQLGAALLWDAGLRAMQSGMGVFARVVDAKDKTAAAFYEHHRFVSFGSNPLTYVPCAPSARDSRRRSHDAPLNPSGPEPGAPSI
jgi:hypothetical protein